MPIGDLPCVRAVPAKDFGRVRKQQRAAAQRVGADRGDEDCRHLWTMRERFEGQSARQLIRGGGVCQDAGRGVDWMMVHLPGMKKESEMNIITLYGHVKT